MPRPEQDNWKPVEVARLLALVETERRYYQELFAALPVPAAVFDDQFALVTVNREFRRRFSLEYQELGRLRLPDLLPSPLLDEAAARIIDGRETRAEASIEVGLREPRTYRVALQRTQGWQDGDSSEILLTVEETTSAGTPALLEVPAPLTAWTLDDRAETFLRVSPECEQRLGIPEDAWQTVSGWAETRVHPADRDAYLHFYRETLPRDGHGIFEYRLFDGDAGPRRVREFLTRGADGRFHGITLDTTTDERAHRRDRERAKREALERLSGRLAHVANNLLMIISGYSEELMEDLPEEDPRRTGVEEIIRASARLAGLTTQLTGFARPAPPAVTTFSWDEALPLLQPDAPPGDSGWLIEGSATALTQFVQEIRRASKAFCPPGAAPAVSLVESSEPGCVDIQITLPGLTPQAADTLFEPFSGPREGSDPPLGAAACISPLETAGMAVDLDPDEAMILIRAQARRTGERAAHPVEPAPPESPPPGPAILLVEDEDGIRALIEKALTRAGYQVFSAPWAEEALSLAQQLDKPADLLISDIVMPGAGGREVAEQLRARWPALRVLFISGHHDDPILQQQILSGRAAGVTLLLRKPFTLNELLSSVETLLGRRRAAGAGTP
jgi:CheY-like chemotaxis protein/PAS domain-containing protein